MLRGDFDSSGARFFDDAPILTRSQVHDKYAAWRSGETVPSEVTAIGFIALTPAQQYLLGRGEVYAQNYTLLGDNSPLAREFGQVRNLLVRVALHDAGSERGKLGSDLRVRAFGGFYRPHDNTSWHSDDHHADDIRYVVCHGSAPTRGTAGTISRSQIATEGPSRGDLLDQSLVARGGQLEPLDFPAGTILRFGPDIHAGGNTAGPRVLHQVTLSVPQ